MTWNLTSSIELLREYYVNLIRTSKTYVGTAEELQKSIAAIGPVIYHSFKAWSENSSGSSEVITTTTNTTVTMSSNNSASEASVKS